MKRKCAWGLSNESTIMVSEFIKTNELGSERLTNKPIYSRKIQSQDSVDEWGFLLNAQKKIGTSA